MVKAYIPEANVDLLPNDISPAYSTPVRERMYAASAALIKTDYNPELRTLTIVEGKSTAKGIHNKVQAIVHEGLQKRISVTQILANLESKLDGHKGTASYEFERHTPKKYSRDDYERYFEKQPLKYHFTPHGRTEFRRLIHQSIPPEEILRYLEKELHYHTSKKGKIKAPKDRFWRIGFLT